MIKARCENCKKLVWSFADVFRGFGTKEANKFLKKIHRKKHRCANPYFGLIEIASLLSFFFCWVDEQKK